MRIYGPYLRKDGRKHVVIIHDDGTRQTKSYPRLLMEQYLGRELLEEETVDHINEDFTDDRIENLQLLTREENSAKAMIDKPAKIYEFICPNCGKESWKFLRDVKANRSKGKKGPYCSRICAGKHTHVDHWNNTTVAQ